MFSQSQLEDAWVVNRSLALVELWTFRSTSAPTGQEGGRKLESKVLGDVTATAARQELSVIVLNVVNVYANPVYQHGTC